MLPCRANGLCALLFSSVTLVAAHGSTPAQKVVQMLGKLKSDATALGKREADEFAEYEDFCAKATEEKSYQIGRSGKKLTKLEANIGSLVQDSAALDTELKKLASEKSGYEKQMAEAEASRANESATYQKSEQELAAGIKALDSATTSMSVAKSDIVSLQAVAGRFLDSSKLASLLEFADKPKTYEFKSSDIIQLLKELQQTFKTNKQTLDMNEIKAKGAFDKLTMNLNHQLKLVQDDVDDKKLTQSQKHGDKAELEAEKEAEKAAKDSDEKTLSTLESDCKEKKDTAAARKKMNEDELKAITAAMDKLSTAGVSLAQAKTTDLNEQVKSSVEIKPIASAFLGKLAYAAPSLNAAKAAKASFLQKRSINRHAEEMAKLNELASRAHSMTLDLAVQQASFAADPFKAVRTLLKDLIAQMEKAGLEEADVEKFCSTEMKKNAEKRDTSQASVEMLSNKIELDNATIQELTADISSLSEDIKEVQSNIAEAQKIREDEKAANSLAVKEATEGKAATAYAHSTLSSFYKEVSFIQVAKAPDMTKKSYSADAQQRSSGVLAMLEVLQSDFEKKIAATKADEPAAAEKFTQLKTGLEDDKKAKEDDVAAKSAQIKVKLDNMLQNTGSLDNAKEQLLLSTAELEKLRGMCTEGDESYEVKKQKRQEQIDRLKATGKLLDEMIAEKN